MGLINAELLWKRVCETSFIALFAASLYDLIFNSSSSSVLPRKMYVAAMLSIVIQCTVEVKLPKMTNKGSH